MTIFGYRINRNKSLRENPLSLFFLALLPFFLYGAIHDSGYFADYRYGESIVPRESQLVRVGPYAISKIRTRHGELIHFSSPDGQDNYSERATHFNRSIDVSEIISANSQAYLWLYSDNPIRKIWKIEIDQQTVLSYDRALFVYRIEASPAFWLNALLIFFVMFVVTMFNMGRVEKHECPREK